MDITPELLDELQRKAKAATPGPWAVNPLDIEYEDNSVYASTLSNGTRRLICTVSTGSSAPGNRAHIAAASPAVVDALVEHIRSLTERLERMTQLTAQAQDHAFKMGNKAMLAIAGHGATGWRVIPFSGSWRRGSERWEVYSPNGSGGAVEASEIANRDVASLLDALAAIAQEGAEHE